MTRKQLLTGDGVVIADHVEEATSVLRRTLGLMFRRELPAGHGLALAPCNSIHMFFMRFPLDIAFCDRNGVVVRTYEPIRPWRVSRIVRRAKTAIELPPGTLAAAGVGKGTRLQLV